MTKRELFNDGEIRVMLTIYDDGKRRFDLQELDYFDIGDEEKEKQWNTAEVWVR